MRLASLRARRHVPLDKERPGMHGTCIMKPAHVAVRRARLSEEAGAGIPHAGIFEGNAGQPAFLPQLIGAKS